jgi:LAS superfamily LD-carboxypeptidase LdcB
MTYPYIKLIVPTALKQYKNGQLAESVLASVKTGGKMYAPVAAQFNKMYDAALAAGFKLKNVGDYRSFQGQLSMFMDRYVTTDTGTGVTRKYEGKTWFLKKGKAPIAQPGKSNHNLGLSVDVSEASGERLAFMAETAALYGFTWELDSEPWHVNYYTGDRVPALVQQWKEAKSLQ